MDRREATVVGALLAGLVSGGLLYVAAEIHLVLLGSVVGITSLTAAFGVWLVFSLLLGAAFGAVADGRIDVRDDLASDAGYGLGFGALAALVVGVVLVPALSGADVPAVNGRVIGAYVLFGVVMAVGYGASLRDRVPSVGVGGERATATLAGSVLGGLAGGAVLYAGAQGFLVQFGLVAGLGYDLTASFAVWLAAAVLLGAVYSRTAARTVGRGKGERLGHLKVGLIYGAVAGIAGGMVLVPVLAEAASGVPVSVPFLSASMLAGFLVYGLALGAGYGAVRSGGRTVPESVADRVGPTAVAGVAGVVAGGLALRLAAGEIYFVYLSLTAKLGASLTAAYATWAGLALVLAWVFVRYVAPEEAPAGLARASVLRGLAFGAVVGGALVALLPAMYEASTGAAYNYAGKNPLVFVGYLVFGGAVGAGYGLGREGADLPAFGTRTQRAVVFGSVFGAFTGGLVIHQLAGSVWMLYFGSLAGTFTYTGSWLVWIGLSVAMGAVFWHVLARDLEEYVAALWEVAEGTDGLLEGWMERAELTTTATALGAVFGVGAAVVVGMVLVPVLVTVTSGLSMPLPTTEPMVIAGYVVYGTFLGLGYGTMQEF